MANNSFRSLMPHPAPRRPTKRTSVRERLSYAGTTLAISFAIALSLFALPNVIAMDVKFAARSAPKPAFPVTVDPARQVIVEDPHVEAMLEEHTSGMEAAVITAGDLITRLAEFISALPAYQMLAGSAGAQVVTLRPGYREEEVINIFSRELGWSDAEKRVFTKSLKVAPPTMEEGQYVPTTYAIRGLMTPGDVQVMLADTYNREIVARYSTSTAARLPLEDALTIASLLEKETSDPAEMRIISGIIWNRLWKGMNLQIDATLQYAKADTDPKVKTWWPKVVPKDKFITSPYNTYMNKGLPPGPIANPSTAAVLAALNPKKTDCLFYFHDKRGEFHCAATYKEHVALLKKYYGQGK